MLDYEVREIEIDKLLLDPDNPRHDIISDQRESIKGMLKDQGEKLLNLASDIIDGGINPSELLIVTPHEHEKDKFIVLEGNRRITALKLLIQPSLASMSKKRLLKRRFLELNKEFQENSIDTLRCVIFPNRENAIRWIRLKHTGENFGVGTVSWNAMEVARFNERLGKASLSLQALKYVKENADLDEDTKNNLSSIAITNLDRLLNDPSVREALGLELEDGELQTHLQKIEVLKGLGKIVKDLATKKINVNDIRSKIDRADYVESFKPKEIPNLSNTEDQPWSLSEFKEVTIEEKSKIKRSKPLSIKRKTLIPKNCILKIDIIRINEIYRELKSLEVDNFRNSVAVMFRVFLEISLDHFISDKGIPSITIKDKLINKVQAAAKYFKDNKLLDQYELKPIMTSISNPNSFLSVNTLNAYVHNLHFTPTSTDLKTTWDNIEVFIKKVWD